MPPMARLLNALDWLCQLVQEKVISQQDLYAFINRLIRIIATELETFIESHAREYFN